MLASAATGGHVRRTRTGQTGVRPALWLLLLALAGLMVGTMWDADGDPSTTNLPSVVASQRVELAAVAGERRGDASPTPRSRLRRAIRSVLQPEASVLLRLSSVLRAHGP